MPLRSSVTVTALVLACEMIRPRPSGHARHVTHGSADMANQTWEFGEIPGPSAYGEGNAVIVLNQAARQGRGEASVIPRNKGSVGLLYLVPGSLGASTTQTWYFKEFPAPDGVTSALAFLNASPRQGAGEVSGYARNDGSAVIFYLEPGSN